MPKTVKLESIVQRAPNVVTAEADPDLVMVSIPNGFYYSVSDVAREIWDEIEHPRIVSEIISDLVRRYNVDVSQCQEHTIEFLEKLLAEDLLLVENGSIE